MARPELRDSHHAVGVLNPGTLVKTGRYAVEVTNPPAGAGPDGSGWAGMSGAGLLCEGLLVGVVTVDPAGFDSRRLVTVPVTAVTADPGFAALVAEHVGAAPIVEPVELAGLAEPVSAPDSPAGLLRADAATTPFRARPELAELTDWCRKPGWSSTRLVAGAGGQGKTRLARHLAAQLAGDGWAAVALAEQVGADDIAVLAEVTVPTLVIVDYAEGRTHQLDALIQAMDRAEAKVRLLLLARADGEWRTERTNPSPHLAVLGDDRFGITLTPATRRCLVATATLWGAATADDARRVLTTTLPGADPDTLANVADWSRATSRTCRYPTPASTSSSPTVYSTSPLTSRPPCAKRPESCGLEAGSLSRA